MQRIKFYGIGGQGVVTAAKVLSIAVSLYEEEYAITVPAYGHERRGAPVYTDIVIDDEPILLNCFVYEPDMVVVCDESAMENGIDVGAGIHEDTILVINTANADTAKAYGERYGFKDIYYVDATGIAVENIGLNIPNGAMLGAVAATGVTSIEAVEGALKEFFGEKAGVKNAKSARDAYEKIRKN